VKKRLDVIPGDEQASTARTPRVGRWPRLAERVAGALEAQRQLTLWDAALVAAPVAAAALWVFAIRGVDVRRTTDLGLISVLPRTALVAIGLIQVSFLTAVTRRASGKVLLLHVVALVFMLYGVTTLIEQVPGLTPTWRHMGITDYILRHGGVDTRIDAYFNWPGFFIFAAFFSNTLGLHGIRPLATGTSMFLNLLYLIPLLVIFRAATRDRRLVWLSAWIFYLTNWVEQDYLSPQGVTYFLYLVIVAIVVRWLMAPQRAILETARIVPVLRSVPTGPASRGATGTETKPVQRAALVLIVLACFAAAVMSHQLMPFGMLFAVIALVVFRRWRAAGVAVLMIVVLATWISFMTSSYLGGHYAAVASHVGAVNQNVAGNVGDRLRGTHQHLLVVYVRLLFAAAVWTIAAAGALRGRIRRNAVWVLLALAPFPLLALQSYGGEVLLRTYLFALPSSAFLAALFLGPIVVRRSAWLVVVGAVLATATTAAFMVARYGNERMDFFTKNEVHAVQRLYQIAPPGSRLISYSPNLPWRFAKYETYTYRTLLFDPVWEQRDQRNPSTQADVAFISRLLRPRTYLILTRSQIADVDLRGPAAPGAVARLERELRRSPQLRVVYSNPDAVILAHRTGRSLSG
jgi:hypothetical protein